MGVNTIKYKQTELGLIPDDWEVTTLSNLFIFKNGLNKEKHFFGYGTPIVNYMDVYKNNAIDSTNLHGKVDVTSAEIKSFGIKKGDVFFTRTSETIDEIGLSTVLLNDIDNGVFSGFILRARPLGNNLNILFCKYCFSNSIIRKEITSKSSYTTRALTSGKALSKVNIAIPSLHEQTAIANALSEMDALIDGLDELIAKKKNLKQGALQKLLKPKEGWVKRKLGEVANIRRGASPRPIENPIWFEDGSMVGWVRISDVSDSVKYLLKTTQQLSSLGIKNSRFVPANNLIMSICATVGKPIINKIDVCIHDGFVVFESLQLNIHFAYYFLELIIDDWSKSGQTGSQMNLNTTIIQNCPISFPANLELQAEIAKILSDMDNELELIDMKLIKAKQLKQGMMQNLLTGKLRLV